MSMRVERRVWLLSLGAVALYGAIAAWVNRQHGMDALLLAGMVQGLSSGATTFTLSTVIDAAHRHLARRWDGSMAVTALAAALGMLISSVQHVAVNLAAGTPALWATVAVPLAATVIYASLYAAAARQRMLRSRRTPDIS